MTPSTGGRHVVLERLGEVPWGELGAAYGPAEWVPETLSKLLSADALERRLALDCLAEGSFHQGTADESTSFLIPFLIELAAEPAVPDRARLLSFVANLVGRESSPRGQDDARGRDLTATLLEDPFAPDPDQECRERVWQHVDMLEALLNDHDPDVRIAAGFVLATLVRDEADSAGRLEIVARSAFRLWESLAGEREPRVQASHTFALGAIARVHDEALGWLRSIETGCVSGSPLGPMAAVAATLLRIDLEQPVDPAACREFLMRLIEFDPLPYLDLPWWGSRPSFVEEATLSEVDDHVSLRLARLARSHPEMWGVLESVSNNQPEQRASALWYLSRRPEPEAQWPPGREADLPTRLAHARQRLATRQVHSASEVVPILIEALHEPDATMRLRAAELFRRIGLLHRAQMADADATALAAAIREERHPRVQRALCRAFGLIKDRPDPPVVAVLTEWLSQPPDRSSFATREEIWSQLEFLAPRVAPEDLAPFLLGWIHDPVRVEARDPERSLALKAYRRLAVPDWEVRALTAELLNHDPDPRVRRAAVASFPWQNYPHDRLPRLEDLLSALRDDPDDRVRTAVAETPLSTFLMDLDFDPILAGSVVQALIDALEHDPSWHVRLEAAQSLGLAAPSPEEAQGVRMRQLGRNAAEGQAVPGSDAATEVLVRAVGHDPREAVRSRAAESLQNVAAAVPLLAELLRTAPAPGRASAGEALCQVGRRFGREGLPDLFDALEREPVVSVRRGIAHAVWVLLPRDAIDGWIDRIARSLRDRDPTVQAWLAATLEHAGPAAAPAAPELAACLAKSDYPLQRAALRALAGIGRAGQPELPAVLPFVASPSIGLQFWALKAVWTLGGELTPHLGALIANLETLRRDGSEKVRFFILELIGAVAAGLPRGHEERPRMLRWLRDGLTDRAGLVRRVCATSLGQARAEDSESIACLQAAQDDREEYVRRAANAALDVLETDQREM